MTLPPPLPIASKYTFSNLQGEATHEYLNDGFGEDKLALRELDEEMGE